jgi:protein-L-isoaspartate(D-aspartate) O-methyltransferase
MNAMNMEQARFNMIEQQVRTWDVLDQQVLDTMNGVPREAFVPERYATLAFADTNIPLGQGQVMMAPKVEGRLLQALAIEPSDTVLEVGTGSGYLTACLARLARHVTSLDIRPEFVESAAARLAEHAIVNVHTRAGDALKDTGDEHYNAIAVTGSLPVLQQQFRNNLKIGGRMFVITGDLPIMEACLVTRVDERNWSTESLFETCIPPLDNAGIPREFEF